MIVNLTKEQIAILSFAMGLYKDRIYEQNFVIPTDMEDSAKTVKEIIDAFDNATEELGQDIMQDVNIPIIKKLNMIGSKAGHP